MGKAKILKKAKRKGLKSEKPQVTKSKKVKKSKRDGKLKNIKQSFASPKKIYTPIDTSIIVSSGSTLLDLAISGGRVRGGGIPGAIMIELYGPSGSGKSSVMCEIGASVQHRSGDVSIVDPESRLDKEYTKTYGLNIEDNHYHRVDTVDEVFKIVNSWEPENQKVINMIGIDSIAALSTELEMEKGDKRGQAKAKAMHAGCRTSARKIAKDNKIMVFTNQLLPGDYGDVTPGGEAVKYYSSVRIKIKTKTKIIKEKDYKHDTKKKKMKKSVGIMSECTITKSSVDEPFRTAPLYIMFGVGIDDIRANLQWLKDVTAATKYWCVNKEYHRLEEAIQYVENNDLEEELREKVINVWEDIESMFKIKRKEKKRF